MNKSQMKAHHKRMHKYYMYMVSMSVGETRQGYQDQANQEKAQYNAVAQVTA